MDENHLKEKAECHSKVRSHGVTLFICLCLLRPTLADNANDQENHSHPWMVEIHYIPALEIWPDKDLDEEHEGVEMDVDLDTGHGYAVRAAYSENGLHPQLLHTSSVSIGVFYLNSHHTNKQDQTKAQAHLVLLDAAYEKMLYPQISGNIGLGSGQFDHGLPGVPQKR